MTKGSYVRETGREAGTKHWGRASLPAQCLTPKVQGLKEMLQLRLSSQDPKGHPLVSQVPSCSLCGNPELTHGIPDQQSHSRPVHPPEPLEMPQHSRAYEKWQAHPLSLNSYFINCVIKCLASGTTCWTECQVSRACVHLSLCATIAFRKPNLTCSGCSRWL